MKTHFYDIESLDNVFSLCNYKPELNHADVYYLCDDNLLGDIDQKTLKDAMLARIYEHNDNFRGDITLHPLQFEQGNIHLAQTFGLSNTSTRDINNTNAISPYIKYNKGFKLIKDVDVEYNENEHPYLMGYNSYNYDTTILAMYLHETFCIEKKQNLNIGVNHFDEIVEFVPTSAKQIRVYNDELFLDQFKKQMPSRLTYEYNKQTKHFDNIGYGSSQWAIRKNMLLSGRHLDVARLNEKQSKVGLKRLLGLLGYQIRESDKLKSGSSHIEDLDQFLDLIAYNISDVVNLELLFKHKLYQGQFTLKKGLLKTYPELVYDKDRNEYKPDKTKIRKDRLTIDSSSAQFASKCLCPYDHLEDIAAVSFMYPAEEKAKELGIPRVNVLEESKKFFYGLFPQPHIRAEFDRVYNYYKSIEGKNFNESDTHEKSGISEFTGRPLKSLPKENLNLLYYNGDGSPSSCFVTFSTGGIHGAEYNKPLFDSHIRKYEIEQRRYNTLKHYFPNAVDLKARKQIQMVDGTTVPVTKFLKSGSTLKKAEYKELKKPQLFVTSKNDATKLSPKYTFTSADIVNHEDFKSYYPNLLRMMLAFFNPGLGYDRYAEIFDDKERYGKLMKDKSLSAEERAMYDVLRDGTKLILNAASGAGDASFDNPIRMNNQIISMRIIGQLFSWRIGQAQTAVGARIISTNTDGLYSVLDPSINDVVLAKESAAINVEIEPEEMRLISKDSNNRFEEEADESRVMGAGGGSLACFRGPTPDKALAHPAILDWALLEYMRTITSIKNPCQDAALTTEFNNDIGMRILKSAKDSFTPAELLRMFQNITASSSGMMSYIFGLDKSTPDKPIYLQHYNRVFIMKDDTPGTMLLQKATATKITPATTNKRLRNNERKQQHDRIATLVLEHHGNLIKDLPEEKEATVKKITNIDPDWSMYIQNKDLNYLTDEETTFILENLDYDKYLYLLSEGFMSNWYNETPCKNETAA